MMYKVQVCVYTTMTDYYDVIVEAQTVSDARAKAVKLIKKNLSKLCRPLSSSVSVGNNGAQLVSPYNKFVDGTIFVGDLFRADYGDVILIEKENK